MPADCAVIGSHHRVEAIQHQDQQPQHNHPPLLPAYGPGIQKRVHIHYIRRGHGVVLSMTQ
ncbi:hypothetical protein ACIPZ8_14490 [Pseudomonas sp. NPDC089422]|uniref:hypothetical protein n=1 Tax=Pseudomonas sp. NPDC089422 TaxID=3364466 RepID=UPI0037F786F0